MIGQTVFFSFQFSVTGVVISIATMRIPIVTTVGAAVERGVFTFLWTVQARHLRIYNCLYPRILNPPPKKKKRKDLFRVTSYNVLSSW